MTPTPQETMVGGHSNAQKPIPKSMTGEEVVISGMSGIFPSSNNVKAFMDNLYNKVDMVTANNPRWVFNHPEVPQHLGIVEGMGKFDAQFFRVHYKQACTMEPMSRKLLEHAYSAIYDSGINPLQLRGKKVGVFVGSTFSESEKIVIYETIQRNGFGITGCNKAMYANRISYWIDGKGPSYALDLACASSMACLEHAYRSISSGQCDAAIVGGCNLCMHPRVSLNLKRAGFLCLDGKTKCFDKNADGYVRSDSISVLFLQKSKDAKRIYSEVYYAKGNYSLTPDAEFLPIRHSNDIKEFLEDFYSQIDVSPQEVDYVEACGSGIAEADCNELEAIGQVFAKDKPVMVGSVKSNMGHSEPASGVCSVTKMCVAYEKGQLPANLHYSEPQDHLPSVRDAKVQILQDHANFNRGFTALNSFSYTGANIHVLLKGHYKQKNLEQYKTNLPRLVLISGRQESCVSKLLTELKSHPIDAEEIGLLHNIHRHEIPGHMCRGYCILDTNENKETLSLSQHNDYFSGIPRPVWFMYSGMGSQWAGMGAELMRIPLFAAAIEKCHKVLSPKGIDIVHILTSPDKTIYDNILHSFVGIAAVQIGLTDVLNALGIVPDNIIGHSVGELGCAYADGCFTAEEMILSAYSRGLVSVQTPLIKGSMAAVGLGYKTILPMCPPEIQVACHNSSSSSTISGPAEKMKEFVAELTAKGIFAKEVPCSNIAYHSQYIANAGPGLLKYLSAVIKNPKPRSEKWVSTSVPQDKWDDPKAKLSSAEYHTNNLLNSVLFEETSKLIPSNAIVIEIAPHGLLQAIVKRSLDSCIHVPLTRRGHPNPVKFFLESIGTLYESGLNPDVSALYPKIEFPVSTGTPFLSHLVEWEHSENWPQAKYNTKDRVVAAVRDFVMSIHDDDFKYLEGHVRNGANVYPEAGILVLIWETFAMQKGVYYKDFSVTFTNVKFNGEAIIEKEKPLRLGIMIHKGNNRFEVSYENAQIASGFINEMLVDVKPRNLEDVKEEEDEILLNSKDIYKIMYMKGHSYRESFRSLHSTNTDRTIAEIKWTDDWVVFIDSLIQLNAFAKDDVGVSSPKFIKKIVINTKEHKKVDPVRKENTTCYNAVLSKVFQYSKSGGVELEGIVFGCAPIREEIPDLLETRDFVPHFLIGDISMENALYIYLQIIEENILKFNIKVTEFLDKKSLSLLNILKFIGDKNPYSELEIKSVDSENLDFDVLMSRDSSIRDSDVFVVTNLLSDGKKMLNLHNAITAKTFVLNLEPKTTKIESKYKYFNVVSSFSVQNGTIVLLKKVITTQDDNVVYVPITQDLNFAWYPLVMSELQKSRKIVLVSERQPYCGLLGLVKNLRKEYGNKICVLSVDDYRSAAFHPENSLYKKQLQKGLGFNILKKGKWGGYYNLPTVPKATTCNMTLVNSVPGDLDSFTWAEIPKPVSSNTLVQVCYAGPTFRDAQKAAGIIAGDNENYGMDFSGIDYKGDRVMGLIKGGSISSSIQALPDLLWPVPNHWSLEDAATVPLPYVHAYYLLTVRSKIQEGDKIFVHGGAGALGQAVISLCIAAKCTVFTTVSDLQKKKFLLRLFPELDENNIGNSRDNTFETMVKENTDNKRCKIVINCSGGSLRKATMNCVGYSSLFLDVNQKDMVDNKEFGMYFLTEERSYVGVDIATVFSPDSAKDRKLLQLKVSEGIAKGEVRPLSRVVYPPTEVSRAFRLLSSSRHRGRAIIRIRHPTTSGQITEMFPRLTNSSKYSYVIVCDENCFGVELAERLMNRGATKLMIHVKPADIDGYFCTKVESWRKQGVTVRISSENLQTEKGCVNLLKDATKMGPVQGVFLAQVAAEPKQTVTRDDFVGKFNGVALVVANLDLISRNLCDQLTYFVVINQSSSNYATAFINSMSERICHERNDVGFPGLYFQIGVLDEIEKPTGNTNPKLKVQSMKTVFNAIEASLKPGYRSVTSYNLKQHNRTGFLEKISKILGLRNMDDVDNTITVNDLRISDLIIEELKTVIKENTGLTILDEKILKMSISNLKELSKNLVEGNTKFESGLGAFFTYIDEDECFATEPMVTMPTKLSNATENEEELDPKATYLMLVPGFEGHHHIFTPICERLKVQAMTFQLGPDVTDNSIQNMAINIMKFMKKRFELKSKFYLLGYSFGVNVALELAALMEKEGHVGIVFCLDSSPESLRVQLDAYLGNLTDDELQNSIVEHMYNLMTGEDSSKLHNELKIIKTWDSKVELCVSSIRGLVHYSHQYKRSLMEAAYKRIILARNYNPDMKLESEIILLKGIPHTRAAELPKDYNLSKYTKKPVKVYELQSDHPMTPLDCRVSNVINKHFEAKILEEFNNKNVCETYLADPFKIL